MQLSKPVVLALAVAFVAIVAVLSSYPWGKHSGHKSVNPSAQSSSSATSQKAASAPAPAIVPVETPEQHEKKKQDIKAEMQKRFEEMKARKAAQNGNSAL